MLAMSLSPIEVLGFVTGVGCVWLAARENIWIWPVATDGGEGGTG